MQHRSKRRRDGRLVLKTNTIRVLAMTDLGQVMGGECIHTTCESYSSIANTHQ